MTKKVFHSKAHRERAQPANRARFGLLEKKKDYVLRARDFQSKKKRLQAMKVKAAYKNPDEFYFGMVKSRVDKATGKVRQEAEHEKLAGDVVKLMKSQDLKHIEEMIRVNEAKLETFKAEHAIIIGSTYSAANKSKGKHVKFVEDDSELADLILDTNADDPEDEDLATEDTEHTTTTTTTAPTTTTNPIIEEYQARVTRLQTLKIAQKKLIQEKLAAAKGRKRKVGQDADGVTIYKFDQERKKWTNEWMDEWMIG